MRNAVKLQAVITLVMGAAVVLLPVAGIVYVQTSTKETLTNVLVEDKERVTTSTGESSYSKYLVFTEGEVFENTDSLFQGKYDSSDVQGKLKVGYRCTIQVHGYRVPWASMYRNILKVEKCEK